MFATFGFCTRLYSGRHFQYQEFGEASRFEDQTLLAPSDRKPGLDTGSLELQIGQVDGGIWIRCRFIGGEQVLCGIAKSPGEELDVTIAKIPKALDERHSIVRRRAIYQPDEERLLEVDWSTFVEDLDHLLR